MEQKETENENREEDDVPCNELTFFKASLQNVLTHASSAISLEKFTDIFKEVPSLVNKPSRVKKMWEVHQQAMLDDMLHNMDEFIRDEDLNTKLKIISEMRVKSGVEKNEVAWRPTLLRTDQYLRSYDMQSKEAKKRKLEEIAVKKEQRVQELRKKVFVERAKANQISDSIKRARETLKENISKDLKF